MAFVINKSVTKLGYEKSGSLYDERYVGTFNLTGGVRDGSQVAYVLTRNNKNVTINIEQLPSGAAAAGTLKTTAGDIPARFIEGAVDECYSYNVLSEITAAPYSDVAPTWKSGMVCYNAGIIDFYGGGGINYANSGFKIGSNCGWHGISFSYMM